MFGFARQGRSAPALGLPIVAALLASAGPASAAPAPITGKLSKPGYTVIALGADGEARSARQRRGRFKLRPPSESVTLHLRGPYGKYAGPIVVRGRGRNVVVGVRAGARLGLVKVRDGYGRVARRLPSRAIDRGRVARARRGVPIGAGVYGRVRSRGARAAGVGDDRDLDGVPGALDIDDDGDLVLDNVERSRRVRSAQGQTPNTLGAPLYLQPELFLPLHRTTNANATALSVADIDAALSEFGRLSLDIAGEGSAELDCGRPQQRTDPALGGLAYCTRGGTGMKAFFPPTGRFPEEFDPDGNGLGAIGDRFFLLHGATTAQIGTGDVLIERITNGGAVTEHAGTLQYVFATVPALVSYSDTAGHAAAMSYPVAPSTSPGCGDPSCAGGPGTPGNALPVGPGPGGDIVLTITQWRPQRRPIEGEACLAETPPCEWVEIGRLTYSAGFNCVPGLPEQEGCALKHCPPSAFSTPDGSEVSPTEFGFRPPLMGGLLDSASDRAASRANSFTYTLNLSDCVRDPRGFGVVTKPIPWPRGEDREIFLTATDLQGGAQQILYLKLE